MMTYNTLYDLFEQQAQTNPDAPALTAIRDVHNPDKSDGWNYAELFALINQTARLIRHYAGSDRPHCAFLLPLIPQTQFIMWGASVAGVCAPLNPMLKTEAIASLLERSETEVLFVPGPNEQDDIWQKIQPIKDQLPKLKAIITVDSASMEGASCHFDDAVMTFSSDPLPMNERPEKQDECAYFHTGGTTGTPKLAIHTHAAQLAATKMWNHSIKDLEKAVSINGLPMFHVAGAILNGICNYVVGGHVVLTPSTGYRDAGTVQAFWKLVQDYRINFAMMIPTTLGSLAQIPVGDYNIESFNCFATGGAIVPETVSKALMENCGSPVHEMYGMTEACAVLALPDTHAEPILKTAGRPAYMSEIRIGNDGAPAGVSGEVQYRGPNLFSGYIGHIEDPFTEDGWLKTGDLGYLDEAGYLFLTGRAKDLIIRSGHNIDPVVIESCLEQHPSVSMAAAVGRPDSYAGELPVVYVELIKGEQVSTEELIAFAQNNIDERPACPKAVYIIPELPKTAVGKIFKPALRVQAIEAFLNEELTNRKIRDQLSFEVTLDKKGIIQVQVKPSDSADQSQIKHILSEIAGDCKLDIALLA